MMDAFEFCRELARMCKAYEYCDGCPLEKGGEEEPFSCGDIRISDKYIQKKIDIVEKWSKKHPVKTMAMDFFEKFPNAPSNNGVPICCPSQIYENKNSSCDGNCEKCWNRPLEEE